MRTEGDDDGGAVVLGGVLLGGADHLLVAEVEAVENADRERQRAWKGGKCLNGAENLHAWGGSFSRGACGPQGEGRSRPV